MNSLALSSLERRDLAARLETAIEGEVLFDGFNRGRYATDASFYQVEPLGVVLPRTDADLAAIIEFAREEEVPLLPRGGGTSQSGQTVGRALVIDFSKYLRNVISFDAEQSTCVVQPGIVLDELNDRLKRHGLWFPVDVSTASRATIGGMAGNNSCGTRSLRYGIMKDNVIAIDAILADGSETRFGVLSEDVDRINTPSPAGDLMRDLLDLGRNKAELIGGAFPAVSRRVGGYNIDALLAHEGEPINLAKS